MSLGTVLLESCSRLRSDLGGIGVRAIGPPAGRWQRGALTHTLPSRMQLRGVLLVAFVTLLALSSAAAAKKKGEPRGCTVEGSGNQRREVRVPGGDPNALILLQTK